MAVTDSGPVEESRDRFTDAYLDGVTRSLVDGAGGARTEGTCVRELAPRAATVDSIALGGHVITPDGPMRGWVTVEGDRITAVTTQKPRGPMALATGGIIAPGLLDLHGHPEFNVFAPWEPPKSYVNRYAWRASDAYHNLIRDPQNKLLDAVPSGTQLRYAEIRSVVGGVTAIQGAGQRAQGSTESLVRDVDGVVFGQHRARSMIDLPSSLTSRGGDDLQRVLAGVAAGEVDAFYVHLGEGMRDNQRSVDEFDHLTELGALTSSTVIIHGTAMTRDQLGQAKDAGAKLVWSPQSNLRLYGETTRVADALAVGLPLALGADWLPSGSTSLLAELKVARQELANQGSPLSARDLVTMVTSGAAAIAGLSDHVGSIAVGMVADLVVLARQASDPYESICLSMPNDVELVLIGGDIVYGAHDWTTSIAADPQDPLLEPVVAWGRPMLLDTSYEAQSDGGPTPRLQQLRADLTGAYPPVGPIWA